MNWQPIETAPKDREIIVWNKAKGSDPRCGYCECFDEAQAYPRGRLCLYHGHAEGLSAGEDGLQIAVWGGGWDDSSHEYSGPWMPDWWFRKDSEFEVALNPTHWLDTEPPTE